VALQAATNPTAERPSNDLPFSGEAVNCWSIIHTDARSPAEPLSSERISAASAAANGGLDNGTALIKLRRLSRPR